MPNVPSPAALEALAAQTTIPRELGKGLGPFLFNFEQRDIASRILKPNQTPRVWVLKSRQIGISSFFCFLDLIWALINPRSKVGIIVHNHNLAQAQLDRVRGFANDLEIPLDYDSTRRIRLAPSQSEIIALTSNSDPNSQTFQALHPTEIPLWKNPNVLDSFLAASAGAAVWGESTARGSGDLWAQLWDTPSDYEKLFYSVEQHEAYQSDQPLTDGEWVFAKEQGFTSKPHAAWWLRELRRRGRTPSGTDLIRHRNDFPLTTADAFSFYEGRWVEKNPPLKPTLKIIHGVRILEEPKKNGHYIAAVDSSGGVGKDGNAVVVMDRETKQIAATWKHNTSDVIDVVDQLSFLHSLYNMELFRIESNGVGRPTFDVANREGLPVEEVWQNESTKLSRLMLARRAIVGGLACPEELVQECVKLHLDKRNELKGPKDLLVCLGMALEHCIQTPYIQEVPKDEEHIYYEEDAIVEW